MNEDYEELKKKFEELEFAYNKNCCKEQELNEQIKQKSIENAELEKKNQLLVKENERLKKQGSRGSTPSRPASPSPRSPPPPPRRPSSSPSSPSLGPHTTRSPPPPPSRKPAAPAPAPMTPTAPATCPHKYVKMVDYKYYKQFNLMNKKIRTKEQLQMRMPMEGMDPSILDLDMNTVGFENIPDGEEVVYPDGHVEPCCKPGAPASASAPSIQSSVLTPSMEPKPESKPEPEPDPYTPPTRAKQTPSVPLRQVYWSTVNGRSLKDTVWESMKELNKVNKKEMETLFSVKLQAPSQPSTVTTPPEEEVVSFVDAKKETNIGIGVRKLRYSGDEVKQFLYRIDKFSLSPEALNVMIGVLPKEEECLTIRSFQGDLEKLNFVNAFLYSVSEIPNCLDRANCLLFRLTFNEEREKHRIDLQNFQNDCKMILENKHFLYLLEFILDIGNYLNGTSTRGGACGFHLDILPQLERTKSSDNTMTLIE